MNRPSTSIMSIYGIEVALLLVGVLSGTLYHMTTAIKDLFYLYKNACLPHSYTLRDANSRRRSVIEHPILVHTEMGCFLRRGPDVARTKNRYGPSPLNRD
ncbi:predicted protein [Histoplasma capsulatum H143]|uniref:Uncharacterized protein n=1 Tax=Ajellomyces capsulatus (strain H143) TaxID=544712 RepID=C6H7H2_AJECH|nr:predicted protein [Histoplasma capsulatum H143]